MCGSGPLWLQLAGLAAAASVLLDVASFLSSVKGLLGTETMWTQALPEPRCALSRRWTQRAGRRCRHCQIPCGQVCKPPNISLPISNKGDPRSAVLWSCSEGQMT